MVDSLDVVFSLSPPILAEKDESVFAKESWIWKPQKFTQAELRLHTSTPVAKGHV